MPATQTQPSPEEGPQRTPRERLHHAVEEAARLLPHQGPIEVFIHQNTLSALQHLPFHEALRRGAELHGARPYLDQTTYLAHYASGRIEDEDIEDAIVRNPPGGTEGDLLPGVVPTGRLRRLLVRHLIEEPAHAELAFRIAEHGLVERLRPDVGPQDRARLLRETALWLRGLLDREGPRAVAEALAADRRGDEHEAELLVRLRLPGSRATLGKALEEARLGRGDGERLAAMALWAACLALRRDEPPTPAPPPRRHRDALLALTGEDTDERVHPLLIRWVSAYLDLGVAHWTLPRRDAGLYAAFAAAMGAPGGVLPAWARGLPAALARRAGRDAWDVCLGCLEELGVPAERLGPYVEGLLLALPGWAGMVHLLEHHPEPGAPRPALVDYLAVRLTLEVLAVGDVARRHLGAARPADAPLALPPPAPRPPEQRAFELFQIFQLAGLPAPVVRGLSPESVRALGQALDRCSDLWRRRVLHEAFERRYRRQVLDALAAHRTTLGDLSTDAGPRFQVLTCIDDREESLRRALEEELPGCETLSGPGFFNLAVQYQGLADHRPVPLCPVVVKPGHDAREVATGEARRHHARWVAWRGRWARAVQRRRRDTVAGLLSGLLSTWVLGWLAAAPLFLRLLFPHHARRLAARAAALLAPRPRTRIALSLPPRGDAPVLPLRIMSLQEQVERAAGLLESVGLVRRFAPIVLILGHGSSSLNNPHESAYDCGACGGRKGGPNARLFAQIANHPDVRRGLRERGIAVPDGTVFIGGAHDTASDAVELFDLEDLPEGHRALLGELRAGLDRARVADAHERARRFVSAPLDLTPKEALRHVEHRAAALDEPRPEAGHATNAVCIVGRRTLSRGLFFDRRAFLQSYDPALDRDGAVLERVLVPAAFVCAGISLEYFFSYVDNERYGAGTKLPHNITGMLGVMNGHQSDLRTGLPWQMVEIHEPMRLLLIVEATPERLLGLARKRDELRDLVFGRWVELVSLDPDTGAMRWFDGERFVPYEPAPAALPVVRRSIEHYRGRREHLPPARVEAALEARRDR